MRSALLIFCILCLGINQIHAETEHAVKALVPGLGHFDAGKKYHGVFFMTTQAAALYLMIEGFGQRESYAIASQKAILDIDSNDDGEALLAEQRLNELNSRYNRATWQAYLSFGAFGVLYGLSIWDAYRIESSELASLPKYRMNVGFLKDAPMVKFVANF